MVRVELIGDRVLAFKLDRMKNKSPRMLKNIIRRSAHEIERRAKENLTNKVLNVRTGQLRRSIRSQFGGSERRPWGKVGTNLIYAPVHEFGATIHAKSAPYLWFRIQTGSRIVGRSGKWLARPQAEFSWARVLQVTIPPRPFMGPAFKESLPIINRIIAEEMKEFKQ